jgi:RNA polymerase sigma-70 factor (ECF subfamily)
LAELSDDDLIRMYREGDADAFDALFDRYHRSAYTFARTMLRRREAAEEVMQEAFLAVARTARSYVPKGRFRPWLMRIVRNMCLNRLAAERRRGRALADTGLDPVWPEAHDPTPLENLTTEERLAALERLVGDLPERQREAIALFAFEQMSYREIAEVMEVPINTVRTLIHRARAALARGMERFDGE